MGGYAQLDLLPGPYLSFAPVATQPPPTASRWAGNSAIR